MTKPHLVKRFGVWTVIGSNVGHSGYWARHNAAVQWAAGQWRKEQK